MRKSPRLRILFLSIPVLFTFCHSTPAPASPPPIEGKASWYSTETCKINRDPDCPMANGQSLYEAEANGELFAASWFYPLGSFVRVTNLENKKSVIVRITDRGPAKRLNRVIDLSKTAFKKIGNTKAGILRHVSVEQIGGAK